MRFFSLARLRSGSLLRDGAGQFLPESFLLMFTDDCRARDYREALERELMNEPRTEKPFDGFVLDFQRLDTGELVEAAPAESEPSPAAETDASEVSQ